MNSWIFCGSTRKRVTALGLAERGVFSGRNSRGISHVPSGAICPGSPTAYFNSQKHGVDASKGLFLHWSKQLLMIVLFIKARLENIARISLPSGYTYTLTVQYYCAAGCI